MKRSDSLEDLSTAGRKLLKFILRKQGKKLHPKIAFNTNEPLSSTPCWKGYPLVAVALHGYDDNMWHPS
jgi:hypothetical protein